MIKFLHAADLHLDSPFHGLGPQEAAARRQEQRQMLQDMALLANSENCDLVLLSGDLFDSENAFPETVEALCRALETMTAKVFIAPGNHDWLCGGSPYFAAKWPENVHIFTKNSIDSVTIPALGCTVYGAGFTSRFTDALLEGFHVADEEMLNIMVLHGDTETAQSTYNPITRQQIAASGLDYLALGHIHLRKDPETLGKTTYAWPGCPMGRGFDELGEKGVYVGTMSPSGTSLTFHALPGRRYEILEVAAGDDPLTSIKAALPENTEQDIYRIRLTGPSDGVDLRSLQQALAPRFYALHLRDETTAKIDIWQQVGEDTLKGQFLSLLQEKMQSATEEEKVLLHLAAQLGLDAMEGREEAVLL